MYFCLKPYPLIVVYNFVIQLVNTLLPALGLFDEKIKKGVIGRKKTLSFLLKNMISEKDNFSCLFLTKSCSFFKKDNFFLVVFSSAGFGLLQKNYKKILVVFW